MESERATAAIPMNSRVASRAAWLLCGLTLALLASGTVFAVLTEPGSLPLAQAMVWPLTWLWVPGAVSILVFVPLYFPDGRLVSRRWRPVALFAVFFCVLAAGISSLEPGDIQGEDFVNPMGTGLPQPAAAVLDLVFLPLWLGLLFVSAASLVVRFRRSGREERQQIKWLAFAALLVPVWFLFNAPVQRTFPNLFLVVDAFALAAIPIAAGIAILRYRLYDIDLVINRTLVYGALTACVVGIYVLVVGYLGALVQTDDNLVISLIATGAVAVLFQPLRERLQKVVNRLMYGERDDPYAALSRLGQRLESTLAPNTVLPTAVKAVAEALKLPYAAIEVEKNGVSEMVAATGEPTKEPFRLPLVYGGDTVGRLALGRRAGEEDFSSADRRLLDDLARQVGVAVHAARLTDEAVRLSADLQRSRERLVTAREEERRRLRRDLHDGLGPQLAAVTMKAEAARDLLDSDPARSGALLEDITRQAQGAVADVRRLVYGLRPPALDELGLLGALRTHAAHGEHGGLRVSVEAPESDSLPPLPAAVEVAAYRIAIEAITNAARHAEAGSCSVRLATSESRSLLLEITDDGQGIPEDRSTGVGLHSMRERAAELGGSCVVESLPEGGTRVRAVLPLGRGDTVGEADRAEAGAGEG